MSSILSAPHFHNEDAAYAWVEARLWPNGPECPRCGERERVGKLKGKSTRIGVHKCYKCRKPFTVKIGTIFESSHVPLRLWLQAIHLVASAKKGISSNQLHRTLGVTLKTAWFMSHRIREAMRAGDLAPPMGGGGGTVEVDETVYGRAATHPKGRQKWPSSQHKNIVMSLVERGGKVRSFHIPGTTVAEVVPVVKDNISNEAAVMTDAASWYKHMNNRNHFASHDRIDHTSREYVRYEPEKTIHTNTVEGYFSVFKRGMRGTYQHCKEKHLHRYLSEFDFRYNNRVKLGVDDAERANRLLKGVKGKRLTYRTPANQKARTGEETQTQGTEER